jgi:hypothetical protein
LTELPVKRRLRNAKRRIVSTLMLAGYTAYTYDSGPFHVCADGHRDSKRIRIVFGIATPADKRTATQAPAPKNCRREIWEVSRDGKAFVIVPLIVTAK